TAKTSRAAARSSGAAARRSTWASLPSKATRMPASWTPTLSSSSFAPGRQGERAAGPQLGEADGFPTRSISLLRACVRIECLELHDPHRLARKASDDFELSAHRLDITPQGAEIHVGTALQLGDRSLFDVQLDRNCFL